MLLTCSYSVQGVFLVSKSPEKERAKEGKEGYLNPKKNLSPPKPKPKRTGKWDRKSVYGTIKKVPDSLIEEVDGIGKKSKY